MAVTIDGTANTITATATNGLGVGQTWQAMSTAASPANLQRLANTDYTNSTGKPIMVSITSAGTLQITVGGVIAARSGVDNATNSLTVIVPAGAIYRCNQAGTWAELR